MDSEARLRAFTAYVIAKGLAGGDPESTLSGAERRGVSRQFMPILKEAVDALDSSSEIAALRSLSAAFIGGVDSQSVFGQLSNVRRVPPAKARLMIGVVEADVVAEETVKPVAAMEFDTADLRPVKVPATIIVSAELYRSLEPTALDVMRSSLAAALARAMDMRLLDPTSDAVPDVRPASLTSDLTPVSASADAAGIGALLAAISNGQPAQPVVIGDYASLAPLAGALRDLRDVLGLKVIVSSAAAGTIIALDEAGLLFTDGGVVAETAKEANVLMDDGGSPAGTTVVSLWQRNLVALRAERFLSWVKRPDAVAYLATG
jgi:hypothetical protein